VDKIKLQELQAMIPYLVSVAALVSFSMTVLRSVLTRMFGDHVASFLDIVASFLDIVASFLDIFID
jgi:hypothetical protein